MTPESDIGQGKDVAGGSLPMLVGDAIRLAMDALAHGAALLAALAVFRLLWTRDALWAKAAAFPAAYLALVAAFVAVVLVLCALIPRPKPGRYPLNAPAAAPWIIGESMVLMNSRSFLGGYIRDFTLPRYLYLRLLGARVSLNCVVGGDALILDPWTLEAGPAVTIGAESVIAGHAIEGGVLTVAKVAIGAGATVGMRSVILPGAEIGPGAIVAAGAVLAKDRCVGPGEVWGGVPARLIRSSAETEPAER